MKIIVKSEGRCFFIPIPLCLGSTAIRIGLKANDSSKIQEHSARQKKCITKEEKKLILKAFKAVKKSAKQYKGLTIVEVKSSEGDEVTITL